MNFFSKKNTKYSYSVSYKAIFFAFFLHFQKKGFQNALFLTLLFAINGNLFALKNTNLVTKDSIANIKLTQYGTYKLNEAINEENQIYLNSLLDSSLIKNELYRIRCLISDYTAKKEHTEAQWLIDKALSISCLNQKDSISIGYLQSKLYFSKGDYQKSVALLKTISEINIHDTNLKNNTLYYLGLSYYKLRNYDAALLHFKKALLFIKVEDSYLFDTHLKLANCSFKLNKIENGFNYLNEGIIFFNENSEKRIGHLNHAKILQLRAYQYREAAQNSPDSIKLLKRSIEDSEQSIQYINKYVTLQYFESDQLIFNDEFNYFFYKTIEANTRLYKAEPNNELLFNAIKYAELDKNLALIRNIQKQKAQQLLQVPLKKTNTIDSLTYELVKTEELIYKLKHIDTISHATFLSYYQQKSHLIQQINEKETELENNYPEYYQLRYKLPELDIDFIKKLSLKKQIIEYVISDEKIYMFLISDGEIYYHEAAYTQELADKLVFFRQLTADINHINFTNSEFDSFKALSYDLYRVLIKPFEAYLNKNSLLIIPDNELNLIPFEALITRNDSANRSDYSTLPYLVNNYDIAYAQSLELLKYQSSSLTNKQAKSVVLTYAPTYKNLPGNEGSQYLALRDARDNLGKLPGALLEVDYIKTLVNAKKRVNDHASELNFKNESNAYTVIHCAMHALVDNNNPLFSKLVFTPDADTDEDGLLNTYEIGHLNINADLVVLSACNTAFGNINKGEGLQSISRGFIKAGCKSILSTLWSVSDETSSNLIKTFYDGLAKGETKSASLSEAKRTFISNNMGIDAHPFYWAGYVFSGNDEPVTLLPTANNWNYLFLIILLIPIAFIIKRKY